MAELRSENMRVTLSLERLNSVSNFLREVNVEYRKAREAC